MAKHFSGRAAAVNGPADKLVPVAPSDSTDLPEGVTRGLFVASGGALAVQDAFGNVATIVSGAGQYHPIRVQRVHATGTTASGIVALY